MTKVWRCFCLPTLFFTTHAQSIWACAPEEFPGQLLGNQVLTVSSSSPKLILVEQQVQDIKIFVNSAAPFWINGPGGKNGTDFLFLETGEASADIELCFYSTFAHSAQGTHRVQQVDIASPDPSTNELLRDLNTAGSAWVTRDTAAIELATSIYQKLAEADLQQVQPQEDLAFFIRFYAALGNIQLRNYDVAVSQLKELQQEPFRSNPNYYKTLFHMGRTLMRLRKTEEGIVVLEEARGLTDFFGEPKDSALRYERANISNMLGEAYVATKRLDLAADRLNEAKIAASDDFELLGKIFNNFGYLSIAQSAVPDLDKPTQTEILNRSTEEHLMASYFASEAKDWNTYQIIENNIAVHYARIGERRKSLIHFMNVIKLLDEIDNTEARAFLYSNLSNYSQILGDYNKAAIYLNQAMQLAGDSAPPALSNYHCRLGTLFRMLNNPEEALSEHTLCQEMASTTENFATQAEAFLQLSIDSSESGLSSEAQAYAQSARTLLPELEDYNLMQKIWTQQAELFLEAGELEQAKVAIDTAIASELDERYPNDKIAALNVAMRVSKAMADTDAAVRYGQESVVKIENLHTQLEAERIGPAWSNQTDAAYTTLATIYLEQYEQTNDPAQLSLAFTTSERSRDISLRQRIASGLPSDTASMEEKEQLKIYSNISSLLAEAGTVQPIPAPATLNYYHQHDLLALARLNNVESLPIPATVSLDEVQANLLPGQLVLYYMMEKNSLYVLSITQNRKEIKKVPREGELQTLLAGAEDLLDRPDSFSASQFETLGKYLLPDLTTFPDVNELVIVGHSSLYSFPFAALSLPDASGTYLPLITKYSLKTVPSLSAYFMDKPQKSTNYSTQIAIIADPIFANNQIASLDPPLARTYSLRSWSESLQSLPYTAQEARNIQERITGNAIIFTGTSATRANLSSPQSRNARILHIATHGYFKSTSEDNIGLALSTIDEAGNPDPGFITPSELFGYAFNNELVVISGCDTAMGQEQAGVGLNSLSRGFIAQGAKHVISTLWPVSDRASAEFMALFYQHLQEEKDVTRALQQAQFDVSQDPDYRNPYYWAGYTLSSVSPDSTIELPD
ncbi:MAG: CHAT domain-containing protein [Pseudomonadota bacterium]